MGTNIIDKYSLLHLLAGIVFKLLNINLYHTIFLNIVFEYLENTPYGMSYINTLDWWPGGKPSKDSLINSISDILFVVLGWYIAYLYT
jgi:hypothetical protein